MTRPSTVAKEAAMTTALDTSGDSSTVDEDSPAGQQELRARVRRHRIWVNIARAAVAVVFLGGWELATELKILDPFFFGQPSQVVLQLREWVAHGTEAGSIWEQIGVTLEEAFLGFIIGVVLGVTFGIAFGRVRLLSEVFGPYIKIMNSIPRIVLGSIFLVWLGLGIQSKIAPLAPRSPARSSSPRRSPGSSRACTSASASRSSARSSGNSLAHNEVSACSSNRRKGASTLMASLPRCSSSRSSRS
jgi:hypothetical protein